MKFPDIVPITEEHIQSSNMSMCSECAIHTALMEEIGKGEPKSYISVRFSQIKIGEQMYATSRRLYDWQWAAAAPNAIPEPVTLEFDHLDKYITIEGEYNGEEGTE